MALTLVTVRLVKFLAVYLALSTAFLVAKITSVFLNIVSPDAKKRLFQRVMAKDKVMCPDGDRYQIEEFLTLNSYKSLLYSQVVGIFKVVGKGRPAADSALVRLDGRTDTTLLSYASGSRPLVVCFGSYTCPPFRDALSDFAALAEDYRNAANFLLVYIEEAHPSDGWCFHSGPQIRQHRTVEQRCDAARAMLHDRRGLGFDVAVDTMRNAANHTYGAFPDRLYIIHNGVIAHEGGKGPFLFNPAEVRHWLNQHLNALDNNNNKNNRK
ncbi:PREDICTED: type I iodothyronine deiodinase-like [Branchiostoma belcheri]|uniref:Iodothyronine deiodinase n=1 Tax=Branchiostoma belcheri TaxID=7741 RepID=A0A6P4XYN8_BRABE|nr:PREDICTED: type I iodothyronine deiodinase-like [Branchiostoma belcheri]